MIEGKNPYDPVKVDLWSLGIVLFTMVCGYLPFCEPDTNKLYKKILSGTYKFPQFLSENVKSLIESMLTVNPDKRVTIE